MLNHRIRGLLFHYKKKMLFGNWLLFLGKSIQKHPDSVCKNDVNWLVIYSRVLYAKPLNERLIHDFTAKEKMLFWFLFSGKSIQNILILSAVVAPFASAGIRPVVNLLNQDTTVYYSLVFCLFFWPHMVKWHNSGIINTHKHGLTKVSPQHPSSQRGGGLTWIAFSLDERQSAPNVLTRIVLKNLKCVLIRISSTYRVPLSIAVGLFRGNKL